ncbi:hypothetical protein ACWEOW_11265 [Monashia sp. NPDC004114]
MGTRAPRYIDGILRQFWDDANRRYTEWDAQGVQTLQRPYTPEENAAADADAAAALAASNAAATASKLVTVDMPAMDAILAQTNADLRTDPSQEIKDMAKAIRRLSRKVNNLTDGVD